MGEIDKMSKHWRESGNVTSPSSFPPAPEVRGHVTSDPPKEGKQRVKEGCPTLDESLVCSVTLAKLLPLSRPQFPHL